MIDQTTKAVKSTADEKIPNVIESGKMLKINSEGEKIDIFNYMKQNVNTWLRSKCTIQPKVTNRENALATWIQIHD